MHDLIILGVFLKNPGPQPALGIHSTPARIATGVFQYDTHGSEAVTNGVRGGEIPAGSGLVTLFDKNFDGLTFRVTLVRAEPGVRG